MDDDEHNPGEPEFGEHADEVEHNPGEPQFGEESEEEQPREPRDSDPSDET
jgi:hypothetical protein